MQSKTNTRTSSLQKCKWTDAVKSTNVVQTNQSRPDVCCTSSAASCLRCDRVFAPRSSAPFRLYQIPSCQISCHPDVICFITVLVGINDSGGVFHSSRCAATAAGCCQRLLEAEGKLPSLQTPSLSWPERCWLSCLFALPGRIKCLLLRWCKFFYYDAFQQP